MLSWVIQISLISIIFIFLVHHLIMFFKSTLTVPKIKDLVNSSNQKYQNIFDTLSNNYTNDFYTDIDLLPNSNINSNINNDNECETNTMKDELKYFLKKQLKGTNNSINNYSYSSNDYNNNDVKGLDTLTGNFSSF